MTKNRSKIPSITTAECLQHVLAASKAVTTDLERAIKYLNSADILSSRALSVSAKENCKVMQTLLHEIVIALRS